MGLDVAQLLLAYAIYPDHPALYSSTFSFFLSSHPALAAGSADPLHSCDMEVVGSITHSALSNFLFFCPSPLLLLQVFFPALYIVMRSNNPLCTCNIKMVKFQFPVLPHSDFLQLHFPFHIAYLFGNGGDEPPS